MTNIVLLRNRPHFGAQITTIPTLRFFKQHCNDESTLTLLSRYKVEWIFKQLPWVDKYVYSESYFSELKELNNAGNLLNLRPSNRLPVLLYKTIKNGQIFDLVKYYFEGFTSHQYSIMNDQEYRAVNYLKIFIQDDIELANALALPFYELANTSILSINSAPIKILMMPGGGGGEFKKWGLLNFIKAGQKASKLLGKACHLHILIGPDETEELHIMNTQFTNVENIFLHTSLPIKDISKLVSLCDITIANDCGPSHIAQCMQKPYIGLFKKTNPEWFLSRVKSIEVTPNDNQDIKTIQVELVTEHIIHLLKHSD
ncbi:MAG: glycosyltransferase family 9 protein [Marinomonas sp.]